MGVSNTVGIQAIALEAEGRTDLPEFTPYADQAGSSRSMLVAAPAGELLASGPSVDVQVRLELAGAQDFAISAFAQNTQVEMAGDWPDPSFTGGAFLPSERTIAEQGFTARWSAPLARRGVPSVLLFGPAQDKVFKVSFVEPTNIYTGVNRAMKYAALFVGLVFLTYFMFEVISRQRAHPAQYVLVGLSQAVFYLLLLAFSERLGFQTAFLIAAGATVAQISLYVWAVFRRAIFVLPALAAFSGVYGLVYVLLVSEDNALLLGAVACFAALAAIMWVTRNVAWYGETRPQSTT